MLAHEDEVVGAGERPALLEPADHQEDRMTGFTFKLESPDGTPADPPTFRAAVPDWQAGHEIYFPTAGCASWRRGSMKERTAIRFRFSSSCTRRGEAQLLVRRVSVLAGRPVVDRAVPRKMLDHDGRGVFEVHRQTPTVRAYHFDVSPLENSFETSRELDLPPVVVADEDLVQVSVRAYT
jgi:hypothetical protein